jgi:mannose/cellobiose epimerase-like protein (N-acyl-D-glucosamine 2-epimerase family)
MVQKKLLQMFLFIVVAVATITAQTNLVQNGDFSGGTSSWTLNQYGGSSSGSVVAGEYNIIVTTAGTEHWHVQFIQTGIPLIQGQTYTFSFDAYKGPQNSGAQSIQVNIGQSNDPWTSYFGSQNQMVTLTTTKTRYVYQITMTEPGDQNARIEFNCGLSSGYFFIDNVSLMESSTPLLTVTPRSLNFGTLLVGAQTTADLTLQNSGSAPTTVSNLSSSSGSFTAGASTPITVPATGSATVPVTFSPTTAGTHSGTFTILSNASDNPSISIALSGMAETPGISFAPEALSFSSTPGNPVAQTLTLINSGSTPVTWSIANAPSWITVVPASGSVPAGSQTTCTANASTSSAGTFTGTIEVTHSASNRPSPYPLNTDFTTATGYQPTCPLIVNPQEAIDFMLELITFRMKQRDNTNGGFYTNIDRQGNWTGANEKALCGQSRIAYAFVRAFMVTGDEQYLEYARHALKFLYDHGWNNGWYFITDIAGNYVSHWGHNDWWSFQQHYALVGISAMVEATGGNINWNDGAESDHTWLMRGVTSNYNKLWDANPATKGYYNYANTAWTNKWGKGFHSTVDGMTTHALLMSMMFDSLNHKNRLVELADNIADHLVDNMANAAAGFPEMFNADWSIDNSNSNMDIGHGFKTAWVLQRSWLLNPDHPEYRDAGHALMEDLWEHNCYDTVYGAPYGYLNWQTGAITGTNKDFWMVEQGYTSGIINYYTAATQEQRNRYLRIADGSLNFFLDHNIDPVYGEAYSVMNRDGSAIVDGNKGGLFTAGYHSVELGYYAYLYGSLYYKKTPVQLYYLYPAESVERTYKLTPIAIEDDVLKITEVTLDGAPYTDFNGDARTVHLPAGIGGKLRVTFGFTPPVTHSITATATTGGSITPSGSITVADGADQSFSINPAPGYAIGDVIVDGSSVGAVSVYSFTNVTGDHSIDAAFSALPTYTITASSAAGGAIAPSGATAVVEGGEQTYTIITAPGYRVLDVLVDGVSIGAVETHTFSTVTADHTIDVSFEPVPTYTITATASSGGTIDPSGAVTVEEGADLTVTFLPQTGYSVTAITVDGGSVPTAPSYTFSNVTGDHTIAVEFTVNTYTITATASSGGSITPQGAISVPYGASQSFTITPSSGYEVSSVAVDGSAIGAVSSYTFSSVAASHTINAAFAEPNPVVYQINTGSSTAPAPFSGDQYNSGGSTYSSTSAIDLSNVVDPAPQSVYQSERYGNCSYTIPNLTPSADYLVRLHFAEIYWTANGSRVFDVAIGGATVLDNFDIYAVTGAQNKAVVREFTAAANGAGEITITLTTVTDNAKISGIEVLTTTQDNPPTIVNAAAANPTQVDAQTTRLSVLADDDNGAALLTYTWSAIGNPPAPVTFTVNGTNAAKATTATFSEAGTYTLEVAAIDQRGQSATSQVVVTVNQTLSSLTVSPATVTVNTSAAQQFSVSSVDQFGNAMSPQPSVAWSVSGGGTISALGLFTAGTAAGGPYTVTAQAGALPASATVTVTAIPTVEYQINTGSTAAASPFTGDQYGSGGTMRTVTNTISLTGVADPAPQAVYQSERYGNSSYTIPNLAAGTDYLVRLHFAELYWTATGSRVFNVVINGSTVLSNFDIYAVTGARYKATVREFTAAANGSGQIVITFTTVTDNATIEGIEVLNTVQDNPPTIVNEAAATPATVTGQTTQLSVLADDDNGEAALTYTWSTSGTPPAPVAFSINGTNGAKATTVTFTKAGTYTLVVAAADQRGHSVSSSVAVTVNQTLSTITVTPATATVLTSSTQQFTASALDQFGDAISPLPPVTWSVTGGGTISATGLFTAGLTAGGPYTVSAQSGSVTGTAMVTVNEEPSTVYQINTGSNSAVAPFSADQYGSGGTLRTVTNTIDMSGVTGSTPAPQNVYKSERYGNSTYTIPGLTAGTQYTVRLHFAELYQTAVGARRFNVAINGSTVLNNFDIYATTGARYKAVIREFTATANGSGQIVITFTTVTDNATIEGIEIIR